MNNSMMTIDSFIDLAELTSITDQIKAINKKLVEDMSFETSHKRDLIITFDKVYQALVAVNTMMTGGDVVTDETKLESVKQLITVHQALLQFRHEEAVAEDVAKIVNTLVVLYPVFLFGTAISNDDFKPSAEYQEVMG